eukprot:15479615-Alexandrium_andersonii.AAC.1
MHSDGRRASRAKSERTHLPAAAPVPPPFAFLPLSPCLASSLSLRVAPSSCASAHFAAPSLSPLSLLAVALAACCSASGRHGIREG